mmetsp:Transcript_5922/g.14726  ORF Transcript_5922/g.14726 Transcript_5922/m.14726 type:complete len:244 (-) Transcript_5922:487-1218(-)
MSSASCRRERFRAGSCLPRRFSVVWARRGLAEECFTLGGDFFFRSARAAARGFLEARGGAAAEDPDEETERFFLFLFFRLSDAFFFERPRAGASASGSENESSSSASKLSSDDSSDRKPSSIAIMLSSLLKSSEPTESLSSESLSAQPSSSASSCSLSSLSTTWRSMLPCGSEYWFDVHEAGLLSPMYLLKPLDSRRQPDSPMHALHQMRHTMFSLYFSITASTFSTRFIDFSKGSVTCLLNV